MKNLVLLSRADGEGSPSGRARSSTSFAALRMTVVVALVVACASLAAQTPESGRLRVPDAAQFVGPPKGTPVTGAELTRRTNEVGALLRCPVCQGMSISDSPAEMAVNMKGQVRDLLARGYTEEQILHYFELSYGQFVLLKPKPMIIWLLPGIALLLGGVIVFFTFRKLSQQPTTSNQQPTTTPEDPYVSRVRDLVSGGKS